MVARLVLALIAVSILALPSAAAASDKPKDSGCVYKPKHRVGSNGAKHVSPFYTPTSSGVRSEYGAPYGRPVTSSLYAPTRIVYRRRCAPTAG